MYLIGVDIGGTGIQAGIVNEEGCILFKSECKTDIDGGFKKVMNDIELLISDLLSDNNIDMNEIKSIGFGVPSFINKKGQVSCVNIGWKEENFLDELKERFPKVPTFAENDATVAALAEAKAGSMKDCSVGVMYTLGTGVGGGIIINGKVFNGAHNMGSEIGHVIIGENYYDCNCGNNGCLETFCSATAIIKDAKRLINDGNDSKILEYANKEINNINAKHVFDAYRENDDVAILVINRFKGMLAKGMAGMINTLDPEIICIGGGVSRASDIILDGLKELVRSHIAYKNEEFADIVVATLGSDAGIIGAAFLS